MNPSRYRWIVYFIGMVIIATLCIQVYWNYKNYLVGKQQLINDVQTSMDNAIEGYFAGLAKQNAFQFIEDSISNTHYYTDVRMRGSHGIPDSILSDSVFFRNSSVITRTEGDSISIRINDSAPAMSFLSRSKDKAFALRMPFEMLTSKVFVGITQDSLSLHQIDSLIGKELLRKNIGVEYGLTQETHFAEKNEIRPEIIEQSKLSTTTQSPYFFNTHSLTLHFSNITQTILRRNMLGILLSFLLVGSVIFCLLYLLKIIRQQKQLAEVKNDLISNITHEFKTPIATIGVAMEGIRNFNEKNDTEKNLRYARISEEQVQRLNVMVEKLLETATLDSEQLTLNIESMDLVDRLRKLTSREIFMVEGKTISFKSSEEEIFYPVDIFHFENAINNIIDNAIKYGGDEIEVAISRKNGVTIEVSDSGNSLKSSHAKQIFEKFYRVPTGNTHDQRGFGIGLYYTRKIVEKHGGSIGVETNGGTSFKIHLPNV